MTWPFSQIISSVEGAGSAISSGASSISQGITSVGSGVYTDLGSASNSITGAVSGAGNA